MWMQDTVLEVTNLTKKIGDATIIDDMSFRLNQGEIKGLLGPNGSGKTTLLKLLVGLLKPTAGSITVEGHSIQKDFEKAISHMGALIENPDFYDYLSGYDNLMQYVRLVPDASKNRLEEAIDLLEMEEYIHDKVESYSLGMRQRLGLAQAFLSRPSILLLDEPTNGLDPEGIQDLRNYLKRLKSEGVSILISSHLLAEIEMICDRVIIVDQGQIVSEGILDDVRSTPSEEQRYFFRLLDMDKFDQFPRTDPLFQKVVEVVVDGFYIQGTEHEVARMNRLLVEYEIDIIGIERVQATLEDAFLSRLRRKR